jgi:uncharacterized protein YfcZ (UPF0381/DUF406 family)
MIIDQTKICMKITKIQNVTQAESMLQIARESAQKGFCDEPCEILFEITAFYERAKMIARFKACEKVLNSILEKREWDVIFDELCNLWLGPGEAKEADRYYHRMISG